MALPLLPIITKGALALLKYALPAGFAAAGVAGLAKQDTIKSSQAATPTNTGQIHGPGYQGPVQRIPTQQPSSSPVSTMPVSTQQYTPTQQYAPTTQTPAQPDVTAELSQLRAQYRNMQGSYDSMTDAQKAQFNQLGDAIRKLEAHVMDPNQFQETLDGYQLGGIHIPQIPDIREDVQYLKDIMQQAPEIPDLRSEMERLRQEYQVEPLESQIHDYDRDIIDAQERWGAELDREAGRPGATLEQMRGRQGELQTEMQKEIGFLELRKNVAVNQLNQKYDVINMMMNLTVGQYELARQDYEMKFNQAFNLTGMLIDNKRYEFESSLKMATTSFEVEQVRQQTALANWQVMTNTIMSSIAMGGMQSINNLSAQQKAQLSKMETLAGLPAGFTQTVMAELKPQEEILNSIVSQDQTKISTLIRQADGTYRTITTSTGLPAAYIRTYSDEKEGSTASAQGLTSAAKQKTDFRTYARDLFEGASNEDVQAGMEQLMAQWDMHWDLLSTEDFRKELSYLGFRTTFSR